jgi:hypothetical protein
LTSEALPGDFSIGLSNQLLTSIDQSSLSIAFHAIISQMMVEESDPWLLEGSDAISRTRLMY